MPYRDELEALEHRQAHLAEELERIDQALGRARALERERADVVRQLAGIRALLARRRSLLVGLRAASPCSASWELMEGGERMRRCQACGKRVYNLSGLSRAEALRHLVNRAPGDGPLPPLRRREDGTLIEGDCPIGSGLRQRGRLVVSAGTAAIVGAGLLASAVTAGEQTADAVDPNAIDGAASVAVELDDEMAVELGETQLTCPKP